MYNEDQLRKRNNSILLTASGLAILLVFLCFCGLLIWTVSENPDGGGWLFVLAIWFIPLWIMIPILGLILLISGRMMRYSLENEMEEEEKEFENLHTRIVKGSEPIGDTDVCIDEIEEIKEEK